MNHDLFRKISACLVVSLTAMLGATPRATAQDDAPPPAMDYPISVAFAPDGSMVVVDLNLPGLWRVPAGGGKPELIYRGSNLLRKTMNRPRCVAIAGDGTILVGDTATREIYAIAADGTGDPKALTNGFIGIPNSLAITGENTLLVADLESHFVYQLPIEGGQPQLFSKTNARGLHVAADQQVIAVLAPAGGTHVVRVNPEGDDEPIASQTEFQFPHNVVKAADGSYYVTDGYAKAVWKIGADGATEKLVEGAPLMNPVGLAIDSDGNLVVADPHAKQLFRIDSASKEIKPLITGNP
jgi:sugar lactone lactonase YvrE